MMSRHQSGIRRPCIFKYGASILFILLALECPTVDCAGGPRLLRARREGRGDRRRPERKDTPCVRPKCWRPHHHTMTKHDAWVPKHIGNEDSLMMQTRHPANRHSSGTGETLPWVVKRAQRDPEYKEEHWWRLRPHDEAIGPEVLSCSSVEPFKFYLMEEALLPKCLGFAPGRDLLNRVPLGARQHLGEMFFYWQLRNHTWRTYDPMEAQLVVVPMFATLLVRGVCGPLAKGIDHVVNALEAFPRYRLNEGKDFLMMTTDYLPQSGLMQGRADNKPRFAEATRNFIFVSRLNGKFMRLRAIQGNGAQGRCVVAAPYTSKHALSRCSGNHVTGLECEGLDGHEKTFEEFMQKRNLTMFFMGQADRRVAYQSRRQIITETAHLREPNFMVASSNARMGRPCGDGDPSKWNGCFFNKAVDRDIYPTMLSSAKLSVFSGGDDPTSSRFYDALTFGTPQIVISEGFFDQGAPFRCAVDHASIYYNLNEVDFQSAPAHFMSDALFRLWDDDDVDDEGNAVDGAGLLRKKWEAQRAAAPDLLWHVPGSRVAHNVLEDAFRRCLTDFRGNNDAA